MNWDVAKGNWKQMKGQVQQKWGKLTNDDLDIMKASGKNSSADSKNDTATPATRRNAKPISSSVRYDRVSIQIENGPASSCRPVPFDEMRIERFRQLAPARL